MTIQLDHVQAGDLVRADFMNSLVDELAALEARVTLLEQTSPPTPSTPGAVLIGSVNNPSPHIGDEIRVTGSNFGFSTGATTVTIGGAPPTGVEITAFKFGSSDSLLIFDVLDLPTPPPASGVPKVLRVANATTDDHRTLTIFPRPVSFQGFVDISFVDVLPANTPAGGTAFARFHVESHANLNATLALTATVSTGWPGVQVMSATSPPVPMGAVSVSPGETVDVLVAVPVPGGTPSTTPFTVTLAGNGMGLSPSESRDLAVGAAITPPAPYIDLEVSGGSITSGGGSTSIPADATSLSAARNATVNLGIHANLRQTGNYDVDVKINPSGSPWTIDASDLSNTIPAIGVWHPASIPPGPNGAMQDFLLVLHAPAAIPAQATQLVITAKKQGAGDKRELRVDLITT
jgi:hypothetical protein